MARLSRKNGISVLVACQNEESLVALCLLSFLDFADELVVVDNGSTDDTRQIVLELQSRHGRKIKFYDAPHLTDLFQNRQFALERSSYRWVVRADADFVAYTDGTNNILAFREHLLSLPRSLLPRAYSVCQGNVSGDFWHTGVNLEVRPGPQDPGRYVPPPVSAAMLRIYEVFPGFRFQRAGRWEATTFNRLLRLRCREIEHPLWMHCNLKSDLNYLYRSERTNWREHGDIVRYPTLESYLEEIVPQKYGTESLVEAASLYMQKSFYPFLEGYDESQNPAYPKLVREQMAHNPIYRIVRRGAGFERDYFGYDIPDSLPAQRC